MTGGALRETPLARSASGSNVDPMLTSSRARAGAVREKTSDLGFWNRRADRNRRACLSWLASRSRKSSPKPKSAEKPVTSRGLCCSRRPATRAAPVPARARGPPSAGAVDLDALERNVDRLRRARSPRPASGCASRRSRCAARRCVRYAAARAGGVALGLMTYTAEESAWWVAHGVTQVGDIARDLVLAYPTVQPADLADLAAANRAATCAAVVDDDAQVDAIAAAARDAGATVPLVVELDVAWRPLGGALHVGVRRSPCTSRARSSRSRSGSRRPRACGSRA